MNEDIKQYFKEEFSFKALTMEHPIVWDFYLSPWQKTKSIVPLLIWRLLLFVISVVIVLLSTIMYIQKDIVKYWLIYLSNWGLVIMLLATGFALLISVLCYKYGPISAEYGLPWYMKTYLVLQNIAVPLAFVISTAYFGYIHGTKGLPIFKRALAFKGSPRAFNLHNQNINLNISTHAFNSFVMFLSLMSVSHPTRILHIYQPILVTVIYMIFNVIYHFAGGVNSDGNPWVYAVIDWKRPAEATAACTIIGVWIILFHLLTIAVAKLRDYFAKKMLKKSAGANA